MNPMSLGTTLNLRKNGLLLAYIANRIPNIHLRKLLKVIYLIDEEFVKFRGFPLTWFDYYAWAKGPVAPEVYNVKDGAFNEFVEAHKNNDGKWVVNAIAKHEYLIFKEMQDFSEAEISLIDRLINQYADKTADELSNLTHEPTSLWSRVVDEKHISFENCKTSDALINLALLNEDNEDLFEIYDDARWNMEFQASLNLKRSARNVPTA